MRRSFPILALALALSATPATAATAWEVTTVDPFRNDSWSFGEIFTVGPNDIAVNALGALDVGLDGFNTTGGIQVGLFDELTSTLLASSNVLSTDPLTGNYRFASIAPVGLSAGAQYRVVAVNGADLYNIATGTPNNVNAAIDWDGYGYCSSSTLQSCNFQSGSERTWMANFAFEVGSAGAVPEPATWAMLLLGFFGLGGLLRKTRNVNLSVSCAA